MCVPERQNATTIIHKCQKSDSGKYVCKIKNEAGEVEVPMEVQVLGGCVIGMYSWAMG